MHPLASCSFRRLEDVPVLLGCLKPLWLPVILRAGFTWDPCPMYGRASFSASISVLSVQGSVYVLREEDTCHAAG